MSLDTDIIGGFFGRFCCGGLMSSSIVISLSPETNKLRLVPHASSCCPSSTPQCGQASCDVSSMMHLLEHCDCDNHNIPTSAHAFNTVVRISQNIPRLRRPR